MTLREQQTVTELLNVVQTLKNENAEFRKNISALIETINKKVDEKHLPISLEEELLKTAKIGIVSSIQEQLTKSFTDYMSPGRTLIAKALENHTPQILKIVEEITLNTVNDLDFQKEIANAVRIKLSRLVVSEADSILQKTFNQIKGDKMFKSKLLVAVDKLLSENGG